MPDVVVRAAHNANKTLGIQEDYWPEMREFSAAERHDAPGYLNADGSTAQLFSSDSAAAVLRHFQWMQAYGIDGAAVQRFATSIER